MHLCPDGIADFIRTLQDSGTRHSEWAIGPYVKKIIVDGRLVPWNLDLRMSTFVCPLSLLSVLLSRLPRLRSLRLSKVLISNDTMPSPNADAGLCDRPGFTLDELVLSDCSAPAHEPHHLPALICLFSNIGSLWVVRWGKSRPGPRHIPVCRVVTPSCSIHNHRRRERHRRSSYCLRPPLSFAGSPNRTPCPRSRPRRRGEPTIRVFWLRRRHKAVIFRARAPRSPPEP